MGGGRTDKKWFLKVIIIIISVIFVNCIIFIILIKCFMILIKHFERFLFYPILSMRVIHKICPACQTTFVAKRKNQLYCTPECREDVNNDKLKAKYHNIKTLEKEKQISDQYKAKFLNAIRVVLVDYDEQGKNEVVTFEGKKFRKDPTALPFMVQFGLAFKEEAANQEGRRVAVYIPHENAICLLPKYVSYSPNEGVTYRLINKKKV